MKIEQKKWTQGGGWQGKEENAFQKEKAQLVFVFGDRFLLEDAKRFEEVKNFYPHAHILLASTSGNILEKTVDDESLVLTAIMFEKPLQLEIYKAHVKVMGSCFQVGKELGGKLTKKGLRHAFLLSDGHLVNGSELVRGLLSEIPASVALTGGLAGDGNRFVKTVVGIDAPPREGEVVVVGFYSDYLKFGFGSVGGWDPFGIERTITSSEGNVLFEFDGKPALDLYKKYLGEQAAELPGAAMLFPLSIRPDKASLPVVRTILSIDEEKKSMTFAGEIPQGWYAQLMKANFDRLVDGAQQAANNSYQTLGESDADLAILISCVGRRVVLGPRTEEEIEGVQEVIGNSIPITGFYSYGEIAPPEPGVCCELHNQTMTITTFKEV